MNWIFSLQKSISKLIFAAEIQLVEHEFSTWFFKIQVQINKGKCLKSRPYEIFLADF